ncbi:hypothetical protein L1987_65477 [Smallanthus sonchifolius]|uniref:Uncharacterized protein n=1 Tax=Smallanthus sonchifolius TaxID=185202 RepID=A0ACB9BUM5_9ASTR|nr:hypothetical protein L1987_65477 [Smallanthus sonchifolius]
MLLRRPSSSPLLRLRRPLLLLIVVAARLLLLLLLALCFSFDHIVYCSDNGSVHSTDTNFRRGQISVIYAPP